MMEGQRIPNGKKTNNQYNVTESEAEIMNLFPAFVPGTIFPERNRRNSK